MKKKIIVICVALFITVFVLTYWLKEENSTSRQNKLINISSVQSSDFIISLVDTGDILFSEKDILSYDDITHTFKLTDEAVNRLESLEGTQGLGNLYQKKFIVKLNNKELYRGEFWSNLSSLTPSGIFMSDPMFAHVNNEIRISAFSFAEPEVKDTLDKPELSHYFESKGKLVSISNDESASSTEKMLLDLIPYQNDYLRISFDYPRYYKDTHCDVAIRQEGEDIKGIIGSRIEMSVTPYSESVLNINHLVSSTLHNIQIETKKNIIIDGRKALQIGYRFGKMNRYGEITYIIHNTRLYTFGFSAGGFECGFEPMVYEKVLDTLHFDL